jgi:NOL1/NOP2/fmu family ribosome biogenesis protein
MFLDRVLRSIDFPDHPLAVLDLCAAPGGKSTLIRAALRETDFLLSNEIVPKRAAILLENTQKWGHENTAVSNLAPESLGQSTGVFDLVVVDAPCSGEGLFRKQEGAVDEWSPGNVQACVVRQRKILEDIWPALKEGGILIYSTCTYNRLENEENLSWLSEQCAVEFVKIPLNGEDGIVEVAENDLIAYRFFPHLTQGEGFFLTAIRKTSPQRGKKIKKNSFPISFDKTLELSVYQDKSNQLYALSEAGQRILSSLAEPEKAFSPGYLLGISKNGKFIPDHGFYQWRNCPRQPEATLNYDESISYLRGEDVRKSFPSHGKVGVSFEGFFLGSGKQERSRLVSKYPKNFRIRNQNLGDYLLTARSLRKP